MTNERRRPGMRRTTGALILGVAAAVTLGGTSYVVIVTAIGAALNGVTGSGSDDAEVAALFLVGAGLSGLLAVASVAVAAAARGASALGRTLCALPGALVLVVLAMLTFAALAPDEPARRPAAASDPPDAVLVAGAAALNWDRTDEFCLLLATEARGKECEDAAVLEDAGFYPVNNVEVRYAGTSRALVRFDAYPRLTPGRWRARLVRQDEGWQLLDVPGVGDTCVDTAPDPWACPVRVVG